MALTPCDACSCIPGNEQLYTWQQKVRQTLCDIASGVVPPVDTDLTNIPAVSIAAASTTVGFTTTGFTSAGGYLRQLGIQNNTNQDIQLSYDGGVTAGPIVPLGQFRQIDFAANGGVMPMATLFMKYLNGAQPTLGAVVIDGFY